MKSRFSKALLISATDKDFYGFLNAKGKLHSSTLQRRKKQNLEDRSTHSNFIQLLNWADFSSFFFNTLCIYLNVQIEIHIRIAL